MFFTGSAIFIILLDNYLKNYHSEAYKGFLYNVSYKLIYFYSKCQIYVNKLLLNLPNHFTKKKEDFFDFEFISNGKVISTARLDEIFNRNNKYILPVNYDFIIYSDHNNNHHNKSCTNKKIMKRIPKKKEDLTYEKSNIKFVSCSIEINENKYVISFKNDTSNYYIKNNIFDINFLKYFLLKYYIEFIKDEDIKNIHDFKIHIIDHNVNFDVSDKKNFIKIDVDNYTKIEKIDNVENDK